MFETLAQATYGYTTTTSTDQSGWIWLIILPLIIFIFWVIYVIALWKIFVKAGIPGWKALIPFYNNWILFELAGKPGWWSLSVLLAAIPIIGIFTGIVYFVLFVLAALELGKAFGKSTTFTVIGLIIFSFIGFLILGFDDSKYTKPASAVGQGGADLPNNSASAAQSPISTNQPTTPQAPTSTDQPTDPQPPTQPTTSV